MIGKLIYPAFLILAVVALTAPAIVAQDGGASQNAVPSVAEILRKQWEASRKQMTAIADAMPEGKFDFRPVPEVRSFGEIVAHFAGENQTWMEILQGMEKPPSSSSEFDKLGERYNKVKTKAELMKALSDTYDYGDTVLAGWDDSAAMAPAPNFGPLPRWRFVLVEVIGHTKEHCGNLVTYLRLNHIVPPASR